MNKKINVKKDQMMLFDDKPYRTQSIKTKKRKERQVDEAVSRMLHGTTTA